MKRILTLIILVVAIPMIAAAAGPQKAGKWQWTMQMEVPGMTMKMPAMSHTVCLTEDDVKDPQKAIPKDPKSDCKYTTEVDGSTIKFTMECPKQKMTGEGSVTYSEDAFTGQMDMTVGEQQMKMKYSGKYLGACDK